MIKTTTTKARPKPKQRLTVTRRVTLTKRDEALMEQEALVFLFMLTRLHDDGTFDDSSEYIANAVMPGQRRRISRAIERLIENKCVAVVEKDRSDKTGALPMILKPVSPLPIWGGKIMFVTRPAGKDDSFLARVRGLDRSHFVTRPPEGVHDQTSNTGEVPKDSRTSDGVDVTKNALVTRPQVVENGLVIATMSISTTSIGQESVDAETVVNGGCTPIPVSRQKLEQAESELRDAEGKLRRIVAECGGRDERIPGLKETIAKSQVRLEELREGVTA